MKRVNMSALVNGSCQCDLQKLTTYMCIIVEKFTQINENIHVFVVSVI